MTQALINNIAISIKIWKHAWGREEIQSDAVLNKYEYIYTHKTLVLTKWNKHTYNMSKFHLFNY